MRFISSLRVIYSDLDAGKNISFKSFLTLPTSFLFEFDLNTESVSIFFLNIIIDRMLRRVIFFN